MRVLSLFGGMECGRIALDLMGVIPDKYYSSEVDKFAIKEVAVNYPDVIQLGDIKDWRDWDIDWWDINLVMGGSPCQGFSLAGKQLAFDDPRSELFFVYVDILNHVKTMKRIAYGIEPDFLLENVKMRKDHLAVITEYMGVEGVFINSALVSAQSRQRWYWTNWKIEQPADRGIYLSDILDDGIGYIKNHDKWIERKEKSMCIDANYHKVVDNHGQRTVVKCGALRGRYLIDGKRLTTQRLEVRKDDNTGSLTTVQKDNLVVKGLIFSGGIEKGRRLHDGKNLSRNFSEGYRIYSPEGKACTLRANTKGGEGGYSGLYGGTHLHRNLTVVECCRLQGVPDDYFKVSSKTQCYKMLGNGWQVDTIIHILQERQRNNERIF
ncbi:MAG: hypothetical protein GY928_05420 [Colwellia sp.]|nr:hypothetical protein [Colwellia sp.]